MIQILTKNSFMAIFMLLLSQSVWSQITNPSTYDLRFANPSYNCATGLEFCADVQIKAAANAPDFAIGAHTVWFYYNKFALSSPVYTAQNFNPQTQCTSGTFTYNPYSSTSFNFSETGMVGEANVTTLLQFFVPGAECPVVSQSWITMGTVCFDIVDAGLNTGLSFDSTQGYTLLNMSTNQPQHNKGTFSAMDISPSAVDAGTVSADKLFVCRDESVVFTATGSVTGGSNYYTGIAVSPLNNLTNLTAFQNGTKYTLDIGPTVTRTNAGSYPANTPLYIYSFIGMNPPHQLDVACHDISAPFGPVIMLEEIQTAKSAYACIGGGQAQFNVVVTGGMPSYNAAETFEVSVVGATYNGSPTVADNAQMQLTVSDGAVWSISFTDSQGCTATISDTYSAATDCPQCPANAGTPTASKAYVCFGDDIDFNVANYTLGDPATGYVAFFTSSNPALTAVPNPAASLTVGPTTTKTNNGSIALDTPLYLYSFIGEGTPFSIDPTCTELSVAAQPFVMLSPITVNTNGSFTYTCTSGNTATVQLAPAGGMPAYNSSEHFTVTTSGGAAYSGGTIANNAPIIVTITANGNTPTPWTVTFTDSQGCSQTVSTTFDPQSCGGACLADAGTASLNVSDGYICWGENYTLSASGYVLGPSAQSYVGLVLSPDNNITAINATHTYYAFHFGPTQNLSNQTANYVNTPLYLYSFIGEGTTAGAINASCTDVSAPIGPFVLLQEIQTAKSAYTCNGANNTAVVNVAASGGLPAYNNAATFTVNVTGATYSGPTQVTNNTNLNLTVNDGSTWSVTFTDSQGCTATISDTFTTAADCPACAANAGTPTLSTQYICWNSSVQFNVTGYNTAGGYVGLATSQTGGISTLSAFIAAGKYTLDNAATATYANDGSLFPLNTPIHLYSFIGQGTPFNIDNSCYDINEAANAFVALSNITVNLNGGAVYDCLANGTANVLLNVQGGLPAYDSNETYTITHSANVTYAGSNTVGNNATIQINVPNNATWSLTFTDSQGCSRTISDTYNNATDCICTFGIVSATPSACNSATNQYTLAVNVLYGNANTGTININGQTFNIDGSGEQSFTLTGLTANGAQNQGVSATLSATSPNCTLTRTLNNAYDAPAACGTGGGCTTPPTSDAGTNQTICATSANLSATSTNGTGQWSLVSGTGTFASSSSATTSVSGLSAGANVFRWTVTGGAGCTPASDDVTITASPAPTSDAGLNQTICATSTNLSATSTNGTGQWSLVSGTGTFANSSSATTSVSGLSAGANVFRWTVTGSAGCTPASDDVTITVSSAPTSFAGMDQTVCGTSVSLNAAAPTVGTGVWSISEGTGVIVSANSNITLVTNLNIGINKFVWSVTNGNCPVARDTIAVTANTAPIANAGLDQTICGTSVTLNAVPASSGTGTWSVLSGTAAFVNTNNATTIVSGLSVGQNTLRWTITSAGCPTVQDNVIITVDATGIMTAQAQATPVTTCGGTGSICFTINGGAAPYQISLNGQAAVSPANLCISSLSAGTYNAFITDNNGCTVAVNDIVVQDNSVCCPTISAQVTAQPAACSSNNGQICLTLSGGAQPYTATVNGIMANDFANNQEQCLSGFAAGNYTVYIDDANGCTATAAISVGSQNSNISATVNTVNATCAASDGQACFTISGGTQPYSVNIDGQTINNFADNQEMCISSLAAGNYTALIIDANNCQFNQTVSVSQDQATITVAANQVNDATCAANDGSICLSLNGGTPPYTIFGGGLSFTIAANNTETCVNNLAANTYSLTATDANGCNQFLDAYIVGQPANCNCPTIAADISVSPEYCNGNNASICVIPSGGAAQYRVEINGIGYVYANENEEKCFGQLNAGTYTVIVTDNNLCATTQTVTVENQTSSFTISENITPSSCNQFDGQLCLTVSNGSGPYIGNYFNGEEFVPINFEEGVENCFLTNSAAATYTVYVTDANGCVTTNVYNIPNNCNGICPTITTDISTTPQLCSTTGAACFTINGGAQPYGLVLDNGEALNNIANNQEMCIEGLAAGVYTATITDANGCTATAMTEIPIVESAPQPEPTVTPSVCNGSTGSICGDLIGTGPYLMVVNGGAAQTITGNSYCAENLSAGEYDLIISDANSCVFNFIVPVGDDCGGTCPTITAGVSTTAQLCTTMGTACFTLNGGAQPYNLVLDNGEALNNMANNQQMCIDGLAAGFYTATITDANGCTATSEAAIPIADPAPQPEPTITPSACNGSTGSICGNLIGAGPYSMTVDGGSAQTITGNSYCAENLPAGEHELLLTDENGCVFGFGVTVGDDCGGTCPTITADISVSPEYCNGNNASICVIPSGGAAQYRVEVNGIGYVYANENEEKCFGQLNAGTYTVVVTDDNLCATTQTVTVENQTSSFTISENITPTACGQSNGQLCLTLSNGSGPYTGNYLVDDMMFNVNFEEGVENCFVTNTFGGAYTIYITDANGCSTTNVYNVPNDCGGTCPTITADVNTTPEFCTTMGTACFTINGGAQPYSLILDNGEALNNMANNQEMCIDGLAAGFYTATITDANGCTATSEAAIPIADPAPQPEPTITPSACNGSTGSVCGNLIGAGPYSMTVDGGSAQTIAGNSYCAENLPAGEHELFITDANGCVFGFGVTVGDDCGGTNCDSFDILTLVQDADCNASNGAICLSITNGTAPYTLMGGNGNDIVIGGTLAADNCIGDLPAGSYNISVVDANGCSLVLSDVVVGQNNCPCPTILVTNQTTNATCQAAGGVCLTVNGGQAPYQVSGLPTSVNIANNNDEVCVGGLSANTYNIIITDNNGCSTNASFTVQQEGATIQVASETSNAYCDNNGFVCLTVSGSQAPYEVVGGGTNITLQENTEQCIPVTAGTYTFTISDANGCQTVRTAVVGQSQLLFTSNSINATCTQSGQVCLTVTSGVAPYSIKDGNTTIGTIDANNVQHCFELTAGMHTISINGAGCAESQSVFIAAPTAQDCQPDTPPVLTDDNFGFGFDDNPPYCMDVLSNDFDSDNDNITITEYTQPEFGSVTLTIFGDLCFVPDPGFSGTASFEYTACDNDGCNTATVDLTVESQPEPCDTLTACTAPSTPIDICVDFCTINNATITGVESTYHCGIEIAGSCIEYTPLPGLTGSEYIAITGCNQAGQCETVVVHVTIGECNQDNHLPVAVDDSQTTLAGQAVTVYVLDNDYDTDGDLFTITTFTQAANGTVVFNSNGTALIYTPNAGFTGPTDSFTYTICDNDGCDQATVTILIDAPMPCDNPNNLCISPYPASEEICVDFCNLPAGAAITDVESTYHCGVEIQDANCIIFTPLPGQLGNDIVAITGCVGTQCETIYVSVEIATDCGQPEPCENPDNLCMSPFPATQNLCVDFCNLGASAHITEYHTTYNCGIQEIGDNCITYQPLPGFIGQELIELTGCDDTGACETVYIHITVGDCTEDTPPVAINDNTTTDEGQAVTINVTGNDQQTDGDAFAIDSYTQPANGTLVLNADGTFTYTPNSGFSGVDTFTYTICDNDGCSTATVTIIVNENGPCNNPESLCLAVYPASIDFCLDFCDLTGTVVISETESTYNCSLVTNGNSCFTYTPLPGFFGNDYLQITGCANGQCQTIYISVFVGDCTEGTPPVAINDNTTTDEGQAVTINVTGNDQQTEGDAFAIDSYTQPANGTVVLNADGTFTYTPNSGFTGTDTFTYTICDDDGCDTATVTVIVTGDEPCENPSDLCLPMYPASVDFCVNFCSIDAVVSLDYETTYHCSMQELGNNCFTYTPLPGFFGDDLIVITGCDAAGQCETITIPVFVGDCTQQQPPIAINDNTSTTEGQPVTINVTGNDQQTDGDAFAIDSYTQPANGTVVLNADGTFTYTPNSGFTGTDTFTYTICDNDGCDTATVTIIVTGDEPCENPSGLCVEMFPASLQFCVQFCDIDGAVITDYQTTYNCSINLLGDNCIQYTPLPGFYGNDMVTLVGCNAAGECETITIPVQVGNCGTPQQPPVAINDNTSTTEGQPVTINVTGNDQQTDGDAFAIDSYTQPANGTVVLNADGTFTYMPNSGFTGTDTFTYTICDDDGCDTATVTIIVTGEPQQQPPVAINDNTSTTEGQPVTINVTGNDQQTDGDAFAIDSYTQPANGTVVLNADGTFTYTPNSGFTGTDTFTYTICDDDGCDTATVTIIVTGNQPCENPDNLCTEPFPSFTQFCVQFCDLDGDAFITDFQTTFNCSLQSLGDNCIQYTPLPGFMGDDLVEIIGCNGLGMCDTVYVNVHVGSCDTTIVNNPPIAIDDSGVTQPNTSICIPILDNDSDPDGDLLTVTAFVPPTHGTISIGSNGCIVYTPAPDFVGTDTFYYQVCDPMGACDYAMVTVTVEAPPCQQTINYVCTEPLTPNLICVNFCDLAGTDGVHIVDAETTFNCSIVQISDTCLQYTALPGFEGQDSLIIVGCNAAGWCDTVTVYAFVGCAAPIANPDMINVPAGQATTINQLANDWGICFEPIVTINTQPSHGVATVDENGHIVYLPLDGFEGTDVLTYTVCNSCNPATACDQTTVTIVVGGGGNPVDAQPDIVQTPYETPVTVDVLANDIGQNLIVTQVGDAENGTVVINPNGTITYYPNDGFSGTDYFLYTVCNGDNVCEQTLVSVTVLPESIGNQSPTANNDVAETPFNTPVTINVLANDSDPENGILTITGISDQPEHGTVTINPDGTITYTPDEGFEGDDYFSYVICDNGTPQLCDTATVGVMVGGNPFPNNPPVAMEDNATTQPGQPVTIDILSNDTDPDGDPLTVSIGSEPAHGSVVLNPDNSVTYTSDPGFEGIDYFTYIICDNGMPQLCDTAYVTITVTNDGLIANDDNATTNTDIPVAINVLENDLSDSGAPLIVTGIASTPTNGTAVISPDGQTVGYIPNTGFEGTDVFSYIVCEDIPNGDCDTAFVTVHVVPAMDAQPDIAFTPEGQPVDIDVLDNDLGCQPFNITNITFPANGNIEYGADNLSIIYTPNAGFVGTDYFTYTVCDCLGNCDVTVVSIEVFPNGTPNQPPMPNNDTATTSVNTPVEIDVLENDTDPDGDPLTITGVIQPPFGGSVTIAPDGQSVIFTPNPGYIGCTTFGYIVCDNGSPALCDTAYVGVVVGDDVSCLNLPPLAGDDEATTYENTPITIDVLVNDNDPTNDPDDNTLVITTLTEPTNGTVAINDEQVTYTPDEGFVGDDFFVYVVCDTGEPILCDTAYVVIHVLADTTALPEVMAQPDIDYTNINVPVTISVLDNDLGENLSVTNIVSLPFNGSVTIDSGNQTVTYTPDTDFFGTDYFEYVVCNNQGVCDTTLVTVIVMPDSISNVAPVAVNDVATTDANTTVCIDVLANDYDAFGGTQVTITDNTQPANGVLSFNIVDSTFCYTPNPDFIGIDSFTYTICDNGTPQMCDEATVVINVGSDTPSNNPPVADDDNYTTNVNIPITLPVLDNDSDPDAGQTITITLITDPLGEAVIIGDTTIAYTPPAGYTGTDFFEYVICDNGVPQLCDTAYVTITIDPAAGPLVDAQPDIDFTNINTPVEIDVLDNDFGTGITIVDIVSGPFNGTVEIAPDNLSVIYTPDTGFVGTDYFEYVICDGDGNCDTTLVTVEVLPDSITNVAPNAVNDVTTTPLDTQVCIDVLNNDSDPFGGDAIVISGNTLPSNGTVSQANDSTFCYTPNPGFTGIDSFTYIICDNGTPQMCDEATVVINVGSDTPSNNPPVAMDDNYATDINVPVVLPILSNDSDPDAGQIITITFLSDPLGTVVLNPDGTVSYTPPTDYVGEDFFSYIICDNGTPVLCDTAYVTIVIDNPANQAPTIVCDETTTVLNTDVLIDVLENDSDPDGDPISIVGISQQPANGTAAIVIEAGDTLVIYMPNGGFIGIDTFYYVIQDTFGLTDTCSVIVTVLEDIIDNTVIAVDDADTTQQGQAVIIPILGNDTYPADGTIEITIIDAPNNGTATVNADNTVTYTPEASFIGTDTFTYVLCATTLDPDTTVCDTAIVVITVEAAPDCVPVFAGGFSPNGDGVNELYLIENADDLADCFPGAEPELIIFNRWGDIMYKVTDYDNTKAWNGKLKGTEGDAPDATYFYIFKPNPDDKDTFIQGCFEVKR